jgi:hypothetical protein
MSATANKATPRARAKSRREAWSGELKFRSAERLVATDRLAKNALWDETADLLVILEISWDSELLVIDLYLSPSMRRKVEHFWIIEDADFRLAAGNPEPLGTLLHVAESDIQIAIGEMARLLGHSCRISGPETSGTQGRKAFREAISL